jgi:hypothetical protein
MRRLLVMSVVVMATIAVFIPSAAATTQTVVMFNVTGGGTDTVDCSFPFSFTSHLTGTRVRFFDDNGVLLKAVYQITERDTYSANSKTLTSDPFYFNLQVSYQDGVLTAVVLNGLEEKTLLPDGTLFLSAGVFISDEFFFPFTAFHGLTGDIDAFCAALSP